MENNKQCPEFPHFGAPYPDARCIDSYLWDLDSSDGEGYFAYGGNDPCPFCNTEEYKQERLDNGWTEKQVNQNIQILNEKYNSK